MRRRVLTILLLLLGGAVVNVGVAWCASWLHESGRAEWAPAHKRYLPDWARGGTHHDSGWPAICLSGYGTDRFGIGLEDGLLDIGVGARLPYGVILRPFAFNTVVYAAILWVVCIVPISMYRRMLSWTNRCTACGYDIRGLARCPECGRARIRDAVRRSRPLTILRLLVAGLLVTFFTVFAGLTLPSDAEPTEVGIDEQ